VGGPNLLEPRLHRKKNDRLAMPMANSERRTVFAKTALGQVGWKGVGNRTQRHRPRQYGVSIVSFEGPDAYSPAGGSGVRMDGPAKALASMAFPVHLFFIGDPGLRLEEMMRDGRLALHRWCQWISRYYPGRRVRRRERETP